MINQSKSLVAIDSNIQEFMDNEKDVDVLWLLFNGSWKDDYEYSNNEINIKSRNLSEVYNL